MTRITRTMYFVLEEGSERTVAICDSESYANWIAQNIPVNCIVRTSQF